MKKFRVKPIKARAYKMQTWERRGDF